MLWRFAQYLGLTSAASMAATGYYEARQLRQLVQKTKIFHDELSTMLARSEAFKPQDRLYSLHAPSSGALGRHDSLRQQLNQSVEKARRLQKKKSGYNVLPLLCHGWHERQLNQVSKQLGSAVEMLAFTTQVNQSLYYFKKGLMGHSSLHLALARNDFEASEAPKTILPYAVLEAHLENIEGKLARVAGQYVQSNEHYVRGLTLLKPLLDDSEVVQAHYRAIYGSQIALWGDEASIDWRSKQANTATQVQVHDLQQGTSSIFKGYALGLANVSWLNVQLADLATDARSPEYHLNQAVGWATEAIAVADPSRDGINPWLFRGVAYLKLGQLHGESVYTEKALDDFNEALKKNPMHASCLRRRAMCLDILGRKEEARLAYQLAAIQLHYLANIKKQAGPYQAWLSDIPVNYLCSHDSAEQTILEQLLSAKSVEDYPPIYQIFQKLPVDSRFLKMLTPWFGIHFHVSSQDKSTALLPKAWSLLGVEGLPTPYELMSMSQAVYQHKKNQVVLPPTGWALLEPPTINKKTGYAGAVFRHRTAGYLVIAHAGTDFFDPQDLKTDFQLACGEVYGQLKDAMALTAHAVNHYGSDSPHPVVYHAGHSLGGALANYVVCFTEGNKEAKFHYAVGFDSPSSWHQLNQKTNEQLARQLMPAHYHDFPATTFLVRPSFINCAGGQHLGCVVQLQVAPLVSPKPLSAALLTQMKAQLLGYFDQQSGYPVSQWEAIISDNLMAHRAEGLLGAFSDSVARLYRGQAVDVVRWPKDLSDWFNFETCCADFGVNPLDELFSNSQTLTSAQQAQLGAFYQVKKSHTPSAHEEVIALSRLESGVQALLRALLLPAQTPLSDEHAALERCLDKLVYNHLSIQTGDDGDDYLVIRAPFTSWQLIHYLRSQMIIACLNNDWAVQQVISPARDFSCHGQIQTLSQHWQFYRVQHNSMHEEYENKLKETSSNSKSNVSP